MSAPEEMPESAALRLVVAEHQLLRPIGKGSAGEVWLARNALGTFRAVKIIFRKSFEWQKPFENEFQGLLKFEPLSRQHDGLVDILQVGGSIDSDCFYYIMELADDIHTGQAINPDTYQPRTLARDLAERHRLSIGECIRLGAPIASALDFLHRQGLIHRDVKPANIIFVNGFPKLADVGLVTELFKTNSRVGTEGFIPPEGAGSVRADVYALGKVLYEISTGKDRNEYPELPVDVADTTAAGDLIRFNKIVLKACRSNPRLRYRDAGELMSDLLAFQFDNPGRFQPTTSRDFVDYIGWICLAAIFITIAVILFKLAHIFLPALHS